MIHGTVPGAVRGEGAALVEYTDRCIDQKNNQDYLRQKRIKSVNRLRWYARPVYDAACTRNFLALGCKGEGNGSPPVARTEGV